jgi:hypothetical protein
LCFSQAATVVGGIQNDIGEEAWIHRSRRQQKVPPLYAEVIYRKQSHPVNLVKTVRAHHGQSTSSNAKIEQTKEPARSGDGTTATMLSLKRPAKADPRKL